MSLTVHARWRPTNREDAAAAAAVRYVEPAPPFNNLAGFESWRTIVWGSEPVVRRGCTVLPRLATGDVYASGTVLAQLEHDVELLRACLRDVVGELLVRGVHIVAQVIGVAGEGPRPGCVDPYETVAFRLANIAEAVRLAKTIPGGEGEVVIW